MTSNLNDIIKAAKDLGPMPKDFKCQYCGKSYVKESTLASHLCEPKRRYQQRNEVGVRLGFMAYQKFYKFTQGKENKTYENFSASPYYTAFVKFGRHLHSINAVKPERFAEWVIKNNKKLDQWTKDIFYSEYLLDYIKNEDTQDALERSILEMQKWAEENSSQVNHYFKYANENKITRSISNGRISPWIIYCSNSGIQMLERLNQEQLSIIFQWIDPQYWNLKFKRYPADTEWCKDVLSKSGF